ncbi:arylsulfatase B-like isoform X2 [Homalodisca vitripennis]|uniref:arylsulfatase B-like isoform X2 n=1 Tax=Homalodisca vitripennis TaxID=197043 RepID=UPI001EEC74FA|nr:arylsulfatase B-like isoform X2 [Homalodisca vitripennis]
MFLKTVLFLVAILLNYVISNSDINRPHIVFIIADDLGWNDVGFHGSNQIPTPNIDALAYSGIALHNYYVSPICTPSRSALMTGKYPIHTGMQHTVLFGAEPRGLPLTERLLPEYLRDLGYVNRLVGKWHLGSYKKEYTPTYRGFDSHLGYWTGHQDYFDHTACETGFWGLDMRQGMDVAWDLHGQYSTDIFTKEAVKLIHSHNTSSPLFLYLAHTAVHSGNPYNPLPAPDKDVAAFTNIEDFNRRKFAAMLSKLDDSVGQVMKALQDAGMVENSIVIFTTDNGGPAAGFNLNAASNWPLRGVKNTLWEGGVRGAGLIWSPILPNGWVSTDLMHISDWLPTLISAAGGNTSELMNIDGVDQWPSMSQGVATTRTEVLHNIDDIYGSSALTVGDWKIVKGTNYKGQWDGWYGPSGRDDTPYDIERVINSPAGRAAASVNHPIFREKALKMRSKLDVQCTQEVIQSPCLPLRHPCLFNVRADPCELNNLADRYPAVLRHLESQLSAINTTAVPPGNLPIDKHGDPRLWDHTWTNFGDYSSSNDVDMAVDLPQGTVAVQET